jgi:hypothetical protein
MTPLLSRRGWGETTRTGAPIRSPEETDRSPEETDEGKSPAAGDVKSNGKMASPPASSRFGVMKDLLRPATDPQGIPLSHPRDPAPPRRLCSDPSTPPSPQGSCPSATTMLRPLHRHPGPALTFSWPGSEQKWRPTAVISIQQTDLSADYAVADGDPAPASRESRSGLLVAMRRSRGGQSDGRADGGV